MNIFKLVGEVFIDTDKANKSLSKTDKNAVGLGKTFAKGIKSAATFASKTAMVVGGMAVGVGASMVAIAETTREYRNEMGKLETAFSTQNLSADQAKSVYKSLQGVLGDTGQAVEASNFIAKLADNEKELSAWTNICTGVYGEFGNSLPIEGLTESANETAKVGQITGSLADALNWAGISEDAFNEKLGKCSSEQERQDLIMNTLNDTYSKSAETFKETNKEVIAANEAQEKLTETTAKIGKIAEPVVTAFKESFVKLLDSAMPTIQYIADTAMPKIIDFGEVAFKAIGDGVQKAIDIFNELKPTFQYVIDTFMPILTELGEVTFKALSDGINATVEAVSDFTKYAKENNEVIGLLAIAIGTITTLVSAYKIQMALAAAGTTLWGVVAGAATGITGALAAVFTFLTSPISLVIIAIGALIAIGYLLYKNWDEVKAKLLEVWENIKQSFSNAKDAIVDKFNEMKEKASEIVEGIKNAIKEKFDAIKNAVSEKVTAVKDAVVGKFNDIKNSASEKFNAVKDVMGHTMDAAKKTVTDNLSRMKSAFDKNGGGFKGAMAAAMEGVKGYFTLGFDFINNLTGGKLDGIKNMFKDKMDSARAFVKSAIDKIKGIFNFSWSLPKIKLPHFKISGSFSLNPPKIPSFGVSWYKDGGIMTKPTMFGYNSLSNKAMVGGEAGPEAILPISKLTKYVESAVRSENGQSEVTLKEILSAIRELIAFIKANEKDVYLDSGALVGALLSRIDSALGAKQDARDRGL